MILCIGVYWGGCGSIVVTDYPSQQDCQSAVDGMRFPSDAPKRGAVAYCRPKP